MKRNHSLIAWHITHSDKVCFDQTVLILALTWYLVLNK